MTSVVLEIVTDILKEYGVIKTLLIKLYSRIPTITESYCQLPNMDISVYMEVLYSELIYIY